MKNLHTGKKRNGSNFGWLIQQMSINQKSGRQTFRRRFVSGSLFVSPCLPECYLQSETKIEPDLRLGFGGKYSKIKHTRCIFLPFLSKIVVVVCSEELCLQQANSETEKDNFTLKVNATSCSKVI